MPSLVPRPNPPEKRARGSGHETTPHASSTPQLLTYGRTMRRGAAVFVLQATKGRVRLHCNLTRPFWGVELACGIVSCPEPLARFSGGISIGPQLNAGVILAHFRIVVRDSPIR